MTGIDEATPRPATIRQRLEILADWFDMYDDKRRYSGDREVQRDLRADANTFSEREALLREAADFIGDTPLESPSSTTLKTQLALVTRIRTALGEKECD